MLIVIEGIDLTGKSTLARRLQEKLGGESRCMIIHAGPPARTSVEEYETSLNDYDPRNRSHLILDRFHLGEYVWPQIFGRETDMDLAVRRHVDMFLESRGAVVVYGERPLELLATELVENDEPLKPYLLQKASCLFEETKTFSDRTHHVWDYEDGDGLLINAIIRHAYQKASFARNIWDTCGPAFVTGSLRPSFLLVGDEQGPKKEGRIEPSLVPFAPFKATSGHYLLGALNVWRHSMIINSRDRDSGHVYDIKKLTEDLGNPRVLALGKRADALLTHDGITHASVPHPQYWRRFNHHRQEEYATMITEALEYV